MADDEGPVEQGPGAVFEQFLTMERIMDNLKLLDYYDDFCRDLHLKPVCKTYFAIQTNPGEQFYVFSSLAAWLIRKCSRQMDPPQEYDEPNATISEILDHVRELGHTVDFPPNKLKQGYGENCIYVLDKLATDALNTSNFAFGKPSYPSEEFESATVDDDHVAMDLNQADDDDVIAAADDDSDDEQEPMMDLGGGVTGAASAGKNDSSRPEEILESTTDAAEWRLELERVLPQLKVTTRSDNKDWRIHVDDMHQHKKGIERSLDEAQQHLGQLHDEIARTLEKISSREKFLNQQLESLIAEYRSCQDRLNETNERYKQGSGGVQERSKNLAEITDELERVKQQMEEHGSSITDSGPLVRIKQAIATSKQEMVQMDIRTGVVEHMLLQAKLKDKAAANEVMLTY